jgi:hypothetical protein
MTIPDFNHFSLLVPTAFSLWFGLLNCARGRLLFGMTTSTVISRIVATAGMAMGVAAITLDPFAALFSWLSLMLWCTPAWDAYWSAEIGNDPSHSRLWGLGMMTLRMLLARRAFLGLP